MQADIFDRLKIYKPDKKTFAFIVIVLIALEFTELKIASVKLSEIILLLFLGVIVSSKLTLHKYIFWFFCFFTLLLIKTFTQNIFTQFYINAPLPLLKQPYYLSLARYAEFLCCVVFIYFIVFFLKNLAPDKVLKLLDAILKIQIYLFGALFFFFYLLYRLHILSFSAYQGFLVYDSSGFYGDVSYRLRGWYFEGGPLGLFYAYLFVLYDWILQQRNKKDLIGKLIIVVIVVLASSKAGGALLTIFFATKLYQVASKSKYAIILKVIFLPLSIALALAMLYNLASNYITTIGADIQSGAGDIDTNTVMGRVSGMAIIPQMLLHNPFFGIGLGNYPLVRNNPDFRGVFPEIPVDLWDAPGLGGLVDLLADGGVVFFGAFILIGLKIYRDIKKHYQVLLPLIFSFVMPFVFGVQLYFLYPWFSIGLIIYFMQNNYRGKVKQTKVPGNDLNTY